MISSSDRWPRPIATAHPTETSSNAALSGCCARPRLIGLPGNTSCSLPKAIRDPQKDTEPTIAAKSEVMVTYPATVAYPWLSRNSTQATRATAPPPTPLNRATNCGIAVILTCFADGTPMTVPRTRPSAINNQLLVPGVSRVATIAIAIPTPAMRLPRTAVRGPVRPMRP